MIRIHSDSEAADMVSLVDEMNSNGEVDNRTDVPDVNSKY